MSELGKTTDPTQLVPGEPAAIESTITAVQDRSASLDQAGDNLKKIDTGAWQGEAGEAFRDKFSYEPGRWHQGSDAFTDCAESLRGYASTLRWAQSEAREAIHLYEEGEQATQQAQAEHTRAVDQARQQNESHAAAGNPSRVEVAPFSDPGEEKRQAARDKLHRARLQLIEAGDKAAATIHRLGDEAPEQSTWEAIGDALGDAAGWAGEAGHTILDFAGLVPGIGEIADLTNAGWYALEGKGTEAALSAAGAIPFAGWAATGGKLIKKGDDLIEAVTDAGKGGRLSRLPDRVRQRIEAGNDFNRVRRAYYPHNEVRLGNNKIVDSYVPGQEIVERKHTQLSEIKPETAKQYLNSLVTKYSPGEAVADTPANRSACPELIGEKLRGKQYLEIPPQTKDIPPDILKHAEENAIIIRDSNGKIYR